jgi:subtilisin-like proprotein convertase family protein
MRPRMRWARVALAVLFWAGGVGAGAAPVVSRAPAPPEPVTPAGSPGPEFFAPPTGCILVIGLSAAAPNIDIPDNDTVLTSTVNVTMASTFTWDVHVTTNITHTRNADLDVTLISPAGTRVSLTTDNGGANDNVFAGTVWQDNASNGYGLATLAPYSDGVVEPYLAPEEPLSALLGENPNGTWTLEVRDDTASESGGLVSWQVQVYGLATIPSALHDSQTQAFDLVIPDGGAPLQVTFSGPAPFARKDEIVLTTQIEHPRASDLEIDMLPAGTGNEVMLASHAGGPNANVFNGTVWSDKAGAINGPGPVTDNTFDNGVLESPLAPQESLRWGANDSGDTEWYMTIADTVVNSQVGKLKGVTVAVTSYACAPEIHVQGNWPELARLDSAVPLLAVVSNHGLTTSAPVFLTMTLPIDGGYLSTTAAGWTCSNPSVGVTGGTVACQRPTLGAGAVNTVTVRLSPPNAPADLGNMLLQTSTAGSAYEDFCDCGPVLVAAHSANRNPWDVYESQFSLDSGSEYDDSGTVEDGGQDAFDGYGSLRLAVYDENGDALGGPGDGMAGFGLTYGGGHRWETTTAVVSETIAVARSLYAPAGENWLRYIDTFTNTSGATRTVWVAWGGNLGSDSDTVVTSTSSSDATLTPADTWAVTVQDDGVVAGDPPVAYILRAASDTSYQGPGQFFTDPFTTTWAMSGDDNLGHVFRLQLASGASASLAYFLYRGVAEDTTGPEDCEFYGGCQPAPAAGSEVVLAVSQAMTLAGHPAFCDLTQAEISKFVNWPGALRECRLFLPVSWR